MTLRRRFQVVLALVLVAFVALAMFAQWSVQQRDQAVQGARQAREITQGIPMLHASLSDQQIAVLSYALTGRPALLDAYIASVERQNRLLADLEQNAADRRSAIGAELAAVGRDAAAWRADVAEPAIAAVRRGDQQAAQRILGSAEAMELREGVRGMVRSAAETADAEFLAARQVNDAARNWVTATLFTAVSLALLIIGGLMVVNWHGLLRPLSRTTDAVRRVSAGELDSVVPALGPPEVAQLGRDVEAMRHRVLDEAHSARQASAEAAAAQARLLLLMDALADFGFVGVGLDGAVTSWSSGAERLIGLPAAEANGRSITDLLEVGAQAESPLPALSEIAVDGPAETTVLWTGHPDGRERWITTVTAAMRDEQGQLEGYALIGRDVTAARAAEEALLTANRELEAANKELEAFAYSVSHDLRAPLRAISGFSRIVLEEHGPSLDAGAQRYLQLVADNAVRLNELIDGLLRFSRASRGPLSKQTTPITAVVREVWAEIAPSLADRRVELEVSELPTVPADPTLLRQVFANLLGNAAKFTAGRESALIRVECGMDPAGSGQPVLTVRDNGAGFDPREADQLFGVFQRLHTDSDFEGTGVGLAIVERIVSRHGGRIWAQGEPGLGASFSFTLGPDTAARSVVLPKTRVAEPVGEG